MHSSFMKDLIEYSGYKPKNGYSGRARNLTTKPPPSQCSMATTTPLVRHVFECFFKNQIADSDGKKKGSSSPGNSSFASEAEAACGVCRNCLKQGRILI